MSESIPLSGVSTPRRPRSSLEHISFPSPAVSYDHDQSDGSIKDIHPPWKRDLYMLLEHPTSSPAAFLIHVVTTGIIILSAVITVLETVPAFHSIPGSVWFGLETSLVALFSVEYIARCIAHSYSWTRLFKWMISFFGIIDLLGIFPYYVEIALQQDTATFFRFTILRTFRLLRVFRPFRYNNTILLTIEVMYLSFRRSQHALLALAFFVVMVLVVFSTLLYFAERGTWDETLGTFINSDGDPSQFAVSLLVAVPFFHALSARSQSQQPLAITTVGYGEITPRSFLGRLVTLPLLVFGLLLIALPTFVLGREFSIVWDLMKENQEIPEEDYVPTSPNLQRLRHAPSVISVDRIPEDLRHPSISRLRRSSITVDHADLTSQISELRETVEMQNEMIRKIMDALEGKGKQRVASNSRPPWS